MVWHFWSSQNGEKIWLLLQLSPHNTSLPGTINPHSISAISWSLFLVLLMRVCRWLGDPSTEGPWNLLAPKMSLWKELREAILKAHCTLSAPPAHFSGSHLGAFGPALPQPGLLFHQTVTGWLLSVLLSHSKRHSLKKALPPHPNNHPVTYLVFILHSTHLSFLFVSIRFSPLTSM